jgi:pimeloyl-ACP methyl ester carboxylesterase
MATVSSRTLGSGGMRLKKWLLAASSVVLAALAVFYLRSELRGYSVLIRSSDPQASSLLLRWEMHPCRTVEVTIRSQDNSFPAQLYLPEGLGHPPGIVLVHGIHHLAINDPRFQNLARALSGAGFAVLAPMISSLADYHVDAASIATIGQSALWLRGRLGQGPVTLMGISFGGGLAMLAAAEPRYQSSVRAIVSIGAYADLGRVSRFLATSEEVFPDGKVLPLAAHDYGAAVFVYDHLEQFFSPDDISAAREALRYFLWEQPEKAQPFLPQLSPEGRTMMEALLARRIISLRPQLLAAIRTDEKKLAAVSPHGKIAGLRVPVFLLHGSTDNVIPPAESLWLATEVPPEALHALLITPVLSHVDLKGTASRWEELRLVHFMAQVLRAAS